MRSHSFKLVIPVCRSKVRRWSFVVRVASVWNSLPFRVVKASSVEYFRRRLDGVLGSRLLDTIWLLMIGYLRHIFECYSYVYDIIWNAICLCIVVEYFWMLNKTCDCLFLVVRIYIYIYIYIYVFFVCFICIGVRIVWNVWSGYCCLLLVVHIGAHPVVPLVSKDSTERRQRWFSEVRHFQFWKLTLACSAHIDREEKSFDKKTFKLRLCKRIVCRAATVRALYRSLLK